MKCFNQKILEVNEKCTKNNRSVASQPTHNVGFHSNGVLLFILFTFHVKLRHYNTELLGGLTN